MTKFIFWICIVFILFIPLSKGDVLDDKKNDDSSFFIQVDNNSLTVKAKGVPLEKVLMDIANQVGIEIIFLYSLDELLNEDFSNLSLEQGLKRLLLDFNYALLYNPEKGENNRSMIGKIFIISQKEKGQNDKMELMIGSTENRTMLSLNKAINDEDTDIRQEALYYLGELKDERSVDLLADILHNDNEPSVRSSAAFALGNIGSETAIDSLMNAMQDEELEVRVFVVEALGEIGGDRAVQALESALSDEEEEVIMTATEELKRLRLKK